ncbi:MAG: BON domain-containing protein, partial [Pirellulales bacterium]
MRGFHFTMTIAAIAAVVSVPALAGDQNDQAKAEQIATILRDSGMVQNYSVGVKYNRGTVWLSGRVASSHQMNTALEVVSDVPEVQKIVNNLAVSQGASSAMQPLAKKASVQASYARRASAAGAQGDDWGVDEPAGAPRPQQAVSAGVPLGTDGPVTPAGYHRLAARKAARHASPPAMYTPVGGGANPPAYDQPYMPNYAWPSYAAYPNYAALTYPRQYSPTAWPYIGPFYPYPQVPLGWRKVALEWD